MLFQAFSYMLLVVAGTTALGAQTIASTTAPAGTGSVRGVVLDEDGKPVAGATVFAAGTAYKPSAVSNDEGQFLLQGLAPGNWGLLAYKKSDGYPANFFAFFSSTGNVQVPSVDVAGGKVTENATVRLGPQGRLSELRNNRRNWQTIRS
jgi:carboxypeptidase family protein